MRKGIIGPAPRALLGWLFAPAAKAQPAGEQWDQETRTLTIRHMPAVPASPKPPLWACLRFIDDGDPYWGRVIADAADRWWNELGRPGDWFPGASP